MVAIHSQAACHNTFKDLDESCDIKMSAFYNYKPVRNQVTPNAALVVIDSRGVVSTREVFRPDGFPLRQQNTLAQN